jgi:hypothetical protein
VREKRGGYRKGRNQMGKTYRHIDGVGDTERQKTEGKSIEELEEHRERLRGDTRGDRGRETNRGIEGQRRRGIHRAGKK